MLEESRLTHARSVEWRRRPSQQFEKSAEDNETSPWIPTCPDQKAAAAWQLPKSRCSGADVVQRRKIARCAGVGNNAPGKSAGIRCSIVRDQVQSECWIASSFSQEERNYLASDFGRSTSSRCGKCTHVEERSNRIILRG
ncbi:unnamed protein product [Ixodes persulcatus]